MLNKKIMVLAIFLVSLFAVSAVSAADNATSDVVSVEDDTNNVDSLYDSKVYDSQKDDGIRTLSFNDSGNTKDYENILNAYGSDAYISDSSNVIDGHGATRDGENTRRSGFEVSNPNVIIKNYVFINGKVNDYGGAIKGGCTVINCTFINNSGYSGGAISGICGAGGSRITAINCTFINNYNYLSGALGGAIYYGDAINCTFMNNYGNGSGGAMSDSSATNCIFVNNSAKWGGACDESSVTNCTFVNNSCNLGSACYLSSVTNCTFVNNYGTLSACMKCYVVDCTFVNNFGTYGGAMHYGDAINCIFVNNSANFEGGACDEVSAINCTFVNNTAFLYESPSTYSGDGGACHGGSATNCIFVNNSARFGGACHESRVTNCTFVNNSAKYGSKGASAGGAIYRTDASYCNFTGNTAYYGGACAQGHAFGCIFENNSANYGGAIYAGSAQKFKFINNFATKSGNDTYDTELIYLVPDTFIWSVKDDSDNVTIQIKSNVKCDVEIIIDGVYVKKIDLSPYIYLTFSIDGLYNKTYGTHYVTAKFIPIDEDYKIMNEYTNFFIDKLKTFVELTVADSVYGEDVVVNVTASENGIIFLTIGNITKEKNVFANTLTKINFGILAANSYDVSVSFDAGDNYKSSSDEGKIIVSPAEAKITDILANDNIYGENTVIKVKTNVGGNLSVKINNIVKTFNIDANKLTSFDLGKYDVNNYNIDLTLDAGANYTQATGNTKVTINPKQTTVSLDANDEVYGNNVVVKVTASENGKLTVRIGNFVKSVDVEANKVTPVDFGILDVNFYEVIATFDGGKNFNTSSDKDSFEISPKASSVTFVNLVNNYIYSNNVVINVKSDVTGTVTVKVGDKTQTKQITAGNVVPFDFGILDVNKYDVLVSLNAGSNYISSQNTASITISPKSTVVTLNTRDYDADEKVIVNVTASENGKATIKLGNVIKNVDVIANKFTSVDFGVLSTGSYDVVATFAAGSNYVDSSDSASIKVLTKIDEKDINIIVPEIKPNQENNIVINLPADATGTVTLIIGENTYTFNVKNGIANINVPKLDEGDYDYSITYSGDGKYSSFTNAGNMTVAKKPVTIAASSVSTVYNGGKYIVATLKDGLGNPISGLTVSINVNGKTSTLTTYDNGQVKLTVNGLAPKSYTATVTFAGNINYLKSIKSVKVTVKKATPKLTAKAKTFKKSVKTKKYSITLKTNQNKPMKNTKVTIKLNKKTYAAKTNSKGIATFKITKLTKKGTFKATITYKGNAYYNKVTKNINIKCK